MPLLQYIQHTLLQIPIQICKHGCPISIQKQDEAQQHRENSASAMHFVEARLNGYSSHLLWS